MLNELNFDYNSNFQIDIAFWNKNWLMFSIGPSFHASIFIDIRFSTSLDIGTS